LVTNQKKTSLVYREDSFDNLSFVERASTTFTRVITRRGLLSGFLSLAGGIAVSGLGMIACRRAEQEPGDSSFAGGELVDSLDFVDEGNMQMGVALGSELDGRLFFDLSDLSTKNLIPQTDKFYIRTRASELLNLRKPWFVKLRNEKVQTHYQARDLFEKSERQGLHLMECAGNTGRGHFGLISVADWEGVPMAPLLDRIGVSEGASRVLISGFDTYASPSLTSVPGASWVFSVDDLIKSRAFLATKMNGKFLTLDHGAPVRLVVPGWYGCCCIKWVNELINVHDDFMPTPQMQEYSSRTHQNGTPVLAREYEPAIIDAAAMPVRVEKWRINGRVQYKVVGIQWGGSQPVKPLRISFNGGMDWRPVERLHNKTTDSWALWTHSWAPRKAGRYRIKLKVDDPTVRTRRLDIGYYDRLIDIVAG
jgi:DMSO/TMAO reductase YedYZ molybdopterin-dependent catalytic subunit